MKILCRSNPSVVGTTYYKATKDEVLEALTENETNIWVTYAISLEGLEIINIDQMFGSSIIDDMLYLCKTDGKDIRVKGEFVDPETALSNYSVSDLSEYIQPATPEILSSMLTEHEIKYFDIDSIGKHMIEEDDQSFEMMVKAGMEINLFDEI